MPRRPLRRRAGRARRRPRLRRGAPSRRVPRPSSAAGPPAPPPCVVDDPVAALGRLARHVLDRVGPGRARAHRLAGQDRHQGLPRPRAGRLRPDRRHRRQPQQRDRRPAHRAPHATPTRTYLVVEMGARGVGHIAYLCEIAPPAVAAVLNVGTAHIGEFGSREAIAQAKGEIVEALPADGGRRAQRRRRAGRSRWRRAPGARVLTSATAGDVSWRDLELDDLGRPDFELGYAGATAPRPADPVRRPPGRSTPPRPPRWRSAAGVPARRRVAERLGTARVRVPLADGAARARRRAGRDQRRLQRQPRRPWRPRSTRWPASGAAPRPAYRRGPRRDEGARRRGRVRPPPGRVGSRPSLGIDVVVVVGRGGRAASPRERAPDGRTVHSPRRAVTRRWPGCARMSRLTTSCW